MFLQFIGYWQISSLDFQGLDLKMCSVVWTDILFINFLLLVILQTETPQP